MSLKKGIFYVFVANLINLIISLAKGFILPKYLSIESYALIQTYLLYVSYVGLLHFGYLDGLYLKYGGKNFEEIKAEEINIARGNTFILQIIFCLPALVFSYCLNDWLLFFFSLSILPLNIATLYKNLFQATGLFKNYSKILNITSLFSFLGAMILLLFKVENGIYYILITIIIDYIIWFFLEKTVCKNLKKPFQIKFSKKNFFENTKAGYTLMLGNFSSIIMTSIDRWFVKIILTVEDFAFYSFSVRVENLITVFITPIVSTMYNYFCKEKKAGEIKEINSFCVVIGLLLIGAAFPVKFILETYLIKYKDSSLIIFFLFATQALYLIIKGVYVNIYKSKRQQNKYFKQLIFVTIIGILLNGISIYLFNNNLAIASATLISVFIWFWICWISEKEIKLEIKELSCLFIGLILFLLLGFIVNSIVGFIFYYMVISLMFILFMKSTVVKLVNIVKNIGNKKGI